MAYKILIVDDEPEMVQMLSRSLSRNGYEIITAFSGKEAITSIKCARQYPDIADRIDSWVMAPSVIRNAFWQRAMSLLRYTDGLQARN